MTQRRKPRWWWLPAAALLTLSVSVGIAEFALSLIPPPAPIPYQWDFYAQGQPVLATDVQLRTPNIHGQYKGVTYYSNSAGFRGPDFEIPKPEGVFRIVILGDSVTMGSGVRYKQAYPYLVEEALNARSDGRRYEVMNFGIDGYAFSTSLAELKATALRYDPDLVVYGFTINDLEGPEYRKSYDSDFVAWSSPSTLLTLLWAQYIALRDIAWPIKGSYAREVHDNFFDHPVAFEAFKSNLSEFAGILHDRGECAVMLIHTQLSALHRYHPYRLVYSTVAQEALSRGIFVVETFPYLDGMNGRDFWVADGDPHPNPAGHEIFAKALLDGLNRLPPQCWAPTKPASGNVD